MPHALTSIVDFIQHLFFNNKSLLSMIVIGLVCGLAAQMILPGRGFGIVTTIFVGIIGAWLGGKYVKSHITFVSHPLLKIIISDTIGAMALAIVLNLIRAGSDRDKTSWRHN